MKLHLIGRTQKAKTDLYIFLTANNFGSDDMYVANKTTTWLTKVRIKLQSLDQIWQPTLFCWPSPK